MAGGTDAHSGHPGHSLEPALTHSDSLMEVDTKDNTGMEDGLTYQPQVSLHVERATCDDLIQAADLEPSSGQLTELKPVKQSVTYDNQTGKVYAELGTSAAASRPPAGLGEREEIVCCRFKMISFTDQAIHTTSSPSPHLPRPCL